MTGRIKAVSSITASGVIEAEDGVRFAFEPSALPGRDGGQISPGQPVTFELEDGKAVNILAQKTRSASRVNKGSVLRYVGFDQVNSVRTFRFERTLVGGVADLFTISADLALLAKCHVTLQEGPAMCLRLLMLDLNGAVFERDLTEKDILADVASRRPAGKHS